MVDKLNTIYYHTHVTEVQILLDNNYKCRYIVDTEAIFEWNTSKNILNQRKHGVSFEEAATTFSDHMYVEIADPDHSSDEERFIALGISYKCRLLVVCYTIPVRDDIIRIISARQATKCEELQYGEKTNARRI